MIGEKREQFRVQIRKEKTEEIFKQKRIAFSSGVSVDFPKESYYQFINRQNMPQCINEFNEYIAQQKQIDSQSETILKTLSTSFIMLPQYPYELSRFLINVTFHMHRDQLWQMFLECQCVHLLCLLQTESFELKENFTIIISNLITDLSQEESLKVGECLQILNSIYSSYTTYGTSEDLNLKFLILISFFLFAQHNEPNLDNILEMIDNISQGTIDNLVKRQCLKTMRAAICSKHIKHLEISAKFDKFLIIDDSLKAIANFIENCKQQDQKLTVYAFKLLNKMLETNKMLMKLLLEKYNLLSYYRRGLDSEQLYEYTLFYKLIYEGLIFIFEDDNQFAMNEQFLIFESLVKQVQITNKRELDLPNNTSTLLYMLLKSKFKDQTVIEFPIIKIVNEALENNFFPLKTSEYLIIIYTVLLTGETIYPDKFVGQFIKYKGEQILMDLQRQENDGESMKLIDEIIKMVEYE